MAGTGPLVGFTIQRKIRGAAASNGFPKRTKKHVPAHLKVHGDARSIRASGEARVCSQMKPAQTSQSLNSSSQAGAAG